MEGIFLRKKFNLWLFILFLCGIFFIGLYAFLRIVDPLATNETLFFLIFGILICAIVIPSWLLNKGAFIHVNENSIKAKYHWFGKIDCKLSDVAFTSSGFNTLVIQLKDNKTHTILGVENSLELCIEIRKRISFMPEKEPAILIKELNELKRKRRNGIIDVVVGSIMMFVNIFLTVLLTDSKETYDFPEKDWIIFAVMGVLELLIVIFTFYNANKTGKQNVPIEKLQYTIKRSIIETRPLLPNLVIAVYTDESYNGRITVFGNSENNSVYFSVHSFNREFNLIHQYDSDSFESKDNLPDIIKSMNDITDKFISDKT